MSLIDLLVLLAAMVVWQLLTINSRLADAGATLQSLDREVFHLAQEQNSSYGQCTRCGRRAVVRHVVPKNGKTDVAAPDEFYCQACWWMSETMVVSEENKLYKDLATVADRIAAQVGPGAR